MHYIGTFGEKFIGVIMKKKMFMFANYIEIKVLG